MAGEILRPDFNRNSGIKGENVNEIMGDLVLHEMVEESRRRKEMQMAHKDADETFQTTEAILLKVENMPNISLAFRELSILPPAFKQKLTSVRGRIAADDYTTLSASLKAIILYVNDVYVYQRSGGDAHESMARHMPTCIETFRLINSGLRKALKQVAAKTA